MNLFYRNKHAFLVAHLTKGVALNITVADAFPRSAIPLPCSRVSQVLLIVFVFFFLMFFTKPALCQVRTSWVVAWMFSFSWQFKTPPFPLIKKSPHGGESTIKASIIFTFFQSNINKYTNWDFLGFSVIFFYFFQKYNTFLLFLAYPHYPHT